MDQLPVYFNVTDRWIAVVGGGIAAARKAEVAARAGARLKVFASHLCEDFDALDVPGRFVPVPRDPVEGDFDGCILVYCATEDEARDLAAQEIARAARIPCNVVDMPDACDFTSPSIVDRSPVIVAISTAGMSPILGRLIRAKLETLLPASYGQVAAFLGRHRNAVSGRLKDNRQRRRFWERLLEGSVVDLVMAGHESEAAEELEAQLKAATEGRERTQRGEVYLVGAGPGDPDLLTFKALRLMQRADVVLYDRLVGDGILNLVRRDAERIYVGKLPKEHTVPQHEISAMLLKLAQDGKRVLRLKGGDPFIFGRGGEEIERLAEAGIPFQVVPGITAASGCSAYAGIPLTHRDHAQACAFVTGHTKDGTFDLDWRALMEPRQTVAVYMGLGHLAELTRAFIDNGAPPDRPAAIVSNGTRPNQQVLTGTLETIATKSKDAGVSGPSVLIVGSVVSLRDRLEWRTEAPVDGASSDAVSTTIPVGEQRIV